MSLVLCRTVNALCAELSNCLSSWVKQNTSGNFYLEIRMNFATVTWQTVLQ